MMKPAGRLPPQGSSSWPRWRQALANARERPSSPRTSRTLPSPDGLGALVAGLGQILALRPTQIQPPAKKWLLLPGEDPGVDIGGAGQHPALAERPQRFLHGGLGSSGAGGRTGDAAGEAKS